MKYKKSFIFICLIICLFSIASISAGDVNDTAIANENQDLIEIENQDSVDVNMATAEVDNEKIESDVISSSNEEILNTKDNGTFTALQDKINKASEGSTINLENDYVYDEGFDTNGIRINKVLTINGNGHTLNGLSKSRIMFVTYTKNTVTLNNIKFYNGYADEGGAINSEGSGYDRGHLTVNNCEFINNKATSRGSAIIGSYLTISNSKFADNNGVGSVLAMFTTDIINCNFENNNGKALQMSATDEGHKLRVKNCIFKNNNGGAIYSNSAATINSSTFDSHVGSENGGAVYVFGDLTVSNSTFTNNCASINGGAICHETDKLSINDSKFINNQASENGGAVYTSGYKEIWSSSTGRTKILIYEGQIENSEFTDNAGKVGGAIYSTTLTYGGVHYGVTVVNSTFSNNNAPTDKDISGGTAIDCVFKSSSSSSSSKTVENQTNTNVVDNSKIVASNVKVTYAAGSYYTIKVYGTDGKLANCAIKISGKISKSLTAKKGIVKFKVTQAPGTYKITISALGKKVTKTITVKKATPKMTAKAKSFKKSTKTKKYTITLKNNKNKVMKNTKVTIKVKGKTYTAKTNKKGVATFKITKLTKKGKYTATVTYKGSKYYNKVTKKVKITVK